MNIYIFGSTEFMSKQYTQKFLALVRHTIGNDGFQSDTLLLSSSLVIVRLIVVLLLLLVYCCCCCCWLYVEFPLISTSLQHIVKQKKKGLLYAFRSSMVATATEHTCFFFFFRRWSKHVYACMTIYQCICVPKKNEIQDGASNILY